MALFGCSYHPMSISWIPVFLYTPYPTMHIPFEDVVTHLWPNESYPKQNSFWPLGMSFVLRLRMIIDVNPLALKPKQHPGFQFMILMLLASPSITKRDFAKNLSHYPSKEKKSWAMASILVGSHNRITIGVVTWIPIGPIWWMVSTQLKEL